jgi:uncharacterized membrane protein YgcG
MTTSPVVASLEPLAAAWLAGGLPRAADALLVSRLEKGRVHVVDGHVGNRGLDRYDRFDAVLIDALGARGRRDVETVRWRVIRDRRMQVLRTELGAGGLLAARGALGRPDRPDRPARTAAGRRLLRELRSAPPRGGVWEVALHGREALTDPALRTSLEPPPRPDIPSPRRRSRGDRISEIHYATGGTAAMGGGSYFGGGFDGGGGWGGDGGGGGGDGGG